MKLPNIANVYYNLQHENQYTQSKTCYLILKKLNFILMKETNLLMKSKYIQLQNCIAIQS